MFLNQFINQNSYSDHTLNIFTFLVLVVMPVANSCAVRLYSHLLCRGFMFSLCYLYSSTCTGVQHDFHIRCMNNTTGVSSRARTAFHSGAYLFPPFTVGFVLLNLQFSVQCFVDHCQSFFLLAIVVSVLRFTDSHYPFAYLHTFI